jgi:hypothetical protein
MFRQSLFSTATMEATHVSIHRGMNGWAQRDTHIQRNIAQPYKRKEILTHTTIRISLDKCTAKNRSLEKENK